MSHVIGRRGHASETYPQSPGVGAAVPSPPTGPAGGDLGGVYPNPTVVAIETTTGPTRLALAGIAVGELLQRVGATVVGVALGALGLPFFDAGVSGAAKTIDWRVSYKQGLLVNANTTLTFTAPVITGVSVELYLTQDGTGSRTVTFPGSVVFQGGFEATLNNAPGSVTVVRVTWTGVSYVGEMLAGSSDVSQSFVKVSGAGATASGTNNTASGANSVAGGFNCQATGLDSEARGRECIASNNQTRAWGLTNQATGVYATCWGTTNFANNRGATCWGTGCVASGVFSSAHGLNCHAAGDYSDVFGANNTCSVTATNSHAHGLNNTVDSQHAHAEGSTNTLNATANYCHVEGQNNQITSIVSHCEGANNVVQAGADYSHTEGSTNTNGGYHAHIQGVRNTATASPPSDFSHVGGDGAKAYNRCDESYASGAFAVVGDNQVRRRFPRGSTPGLALGETTQLVCGSDVTFGGLENSKAYGCTVVATATKMGLGAAARQTAFFNFAFIASVDSAGTVTISAVTVVVPTILQGAAFVGAALVPVTGGANNLQLQWAIAAGLIIKSRIVAEVTISEVLGD